LDFVGLFRTATGRLWWLVWFAHQIGDRSEQTGGAAKRFVSSEQIWTGIFSYGIATARFVFGSISCSETLFLHQVFGILLRGLLNDDVDA
jgi:hypothetical protein